uniref:Cerberus 1, DAN family BMP antagonist n=2 Tax=Latimeria chalumnae TaxID=7897 RepID=H3A159_LATCH
MFLLLLQLFVISVLAESVERRDLTRKKGRKSHLLNHRGQGKREAMGEDLLLGSAENLSLEGKFAEVSQLCETAHRESLKKEKKNGRSKKSSRSNPYHTELQARGLDSSDQGAGRSLPLANLADATPTPPNNRNAEPPHWKNAKKFWNNFLFRRGANFQELVLPIKTNEVQQETCRTLPFSQSIVHENCEKVVVQNKLCFGRCTSFHVPGPEDRLYTFCSHCLPNKFTMNRMELNCTGSTTVVKVVMVVEECKCEVQK